MGTSEVRGVSGRRARRAALAVAALAGLHAATLAACSETPEGRGSAGGTGGSQTSSTSSSGGDGSAPEPADFSRLALPCTEDSACGSGGRCVTVADNDPYFHGGPAAGYCTRACLSDAECGTGNFCRTDENGGICLLGCIPGTPELVHLDDDLDPNKCHGREDVGCWRLDTAANRGICIPACGSDAQCGGRKCDPLYGVCVDTPTTGLPTGAPCPGTGEECAGICIEDPDHNSQCTTQCVFGGRLSGSSDCGGLEHGLCVIKFMDTDVSGVGDIGACAGACREHSDCQNPYLWCKSTPVTQNGFCTPASPCPRGESQCPGDGAVCTPTAYGPYCIDPAFALGAAAEPGAGGAGGAGGGP